MFRDKAWNMCAEHNLVRDLKENGSAKCSKR